MGSESGRPLVLAVARLPALRRSLTRALTPDVHVRELGLADLGQAAALVDAAAAAVWLDAGDDPGSLAALRGLPAGAALVLVLESQPADRLEALLDELEPAQVLSAPVAAPLLRFAVQRAFASARPGEGARANQRRAPVLLGVSSAIREVLEQVKQVADSRIPVLVLGETGTGKELVARALHERSARRGRAFVPVNCGALPEALLESELFGYRKGAFTGADRDRAGLFEEADGGTLFLDEIGEMPASLQVKLLRALESRKVRAVGDTLEREVDVRLVSATNRNLEAAVEEGSFRRDLFYRINTVTIGIPPLRRRRVDIPFLAQHFAEEFGSAHARRIALDEGFVDTLCRFDFPGNVRELRNAVERAIALADPDGPVTVRHLVSASGRALEIPLPPGGTLRERLDRVEREILREALEAHDLNRSRAAASLGLSRQGLRYKMRRLGLRE
jgi:transcriptional regulator with PAS, ATPase and Fis domain